MPPAIHLWLELTHQRCGWSSIIFRRLNVYLSLLTGFKHTKCMFPLTLWWARVLLPFCHISWGLQSKLWQHNRRSYGKASPGNFLRSKEFRVRWPLLCCSFFGAILKAGTHNQRSANGYISPRTTVLLSTACSRLHPPTDTLTDTLLSRLLHRTFTPSPSFRMGQGQSGNKTNLLNCRTEWNTIC